MGERAAAMAVMFIESCAGGLDTHQQLMKIHNRRQEPVTTWDYKATHIQDVKLSKTIGLNRLDWNEPSRTKF